MLREYLIFIFIFWAVWVSCNYNERDAEKAKPRGAASHGAKEVVNPAKMGAVAPFDMASAYSDLFLEPARVDSFIVHQPMDDSLANEMRGLYRQRHFQFAWFAKDGLTEQALSFYSLYNYSKDSTEPRKWLDRHFDQLMNTDSLLPEATDSTMQRTELLMSWRFLNYVNNRYPDKGGRSEAIKQLLPVKKQDPMKMAAAVVSEGEDKTDNPWYPLLKARLKRYVDSSQTDSVRKILINLERMKWMPPHPEGKLILVNIPEFRMHVSEDGNTVFEMKLVVGKEGHSTILFSGILDRIIFNPYWNVPQSIVKKEILPAMKKHKDYLEKNDMEIIGQSDGLPVIRQLPGKKNELGQMKFVFPNSFDIYFHDTPHKELFSKSQRAYSHGCIRLAQPRKLADYLLQPMPEWTKERVDSVLSTGKEYTVKLSIPVPVLICYFTAWAEDDKLAFRKDIYGHDSTLAKKLFVR
jgi:hypothetical protein